MIVNIFLCVYGCSIDKFGQKDKGKGNYGISFHFTVIVSYEKLSTFYIVL